MTGDGELQEGQIWESLQPVANEKLGEIVVIVDHNKLQSDSLVSAVSDLGPIEDKFRAFGWEVRRGDGHDPAAIRDVLAQFATVTDRPKVFIADTIKGKGVSFMEGAGLRRPDLSLPRRRAVAEGLPGGDDGARSSASTIGCARSSSRRWRSSRAPLPVRITPTKPEKIVLAYGDELLAMARHAAGDRRARRRPADRLRHRGVPRGAARSVHRVRHRRAAHGVGRRRPGAQRACCRSCIRSPASCRRAPTSTSTTTRPSGGRSSTRRRSPASCPGGPGHSHQSVRDISAIGAVPGLVAFEPCSEREARLAIRWAVEENADSTYLRFVNVPLDLPYALPDGLPRSTSDAASTLRPGRRRRHRRLRPAADDAAPGAPPTSSRGRASAPRSSIFRGSIASTTSGWRRARRAIR